MQAKSIVTPIIILILGGMLALGIFSVIQVTKTPESSKQPLALTEPDDTLPVATTTTTPIITPPPPPLPSGFKWVIQDRVKFAVPEEWEVPTEDFTNSLNNEPRTYSYLRSAIERLGERSQILVSPDYKERIIEAHEVGHDYEIEEGWSFRVYAAFSLRSLDSSGVPSDGYIDICNQSLDITEEVCETFVNQYGWGIWYLSSFRGNQISTNPLQTIHTAESTVSGYYISVRLQGNLTNTSNVLLKQILGTVHLTEES